MKTTKFIFAAFFFVLAFTSCKKEGSTTELIDNPNPEPTAYDLAAASMGGIMYDKFWAAESTFDPADANFNTYNDNSNFFRCKQCHAWDGLGNSGSYISRGANATRPHVSDINLYQVSQTLTAQELYDLMTTDVDRRDASFDFTSYDPDANFTEGDKMPNYADILSEDELWDLVKFMKEGLWDVSQLYDAVYEGTYPTGSATFSNVGLDGDADAGNAFYVSASCVLCHGDDGLTLELEGKSLGEFIRSKPNEVQHKVKYGQLGSAMLGEFDITVSEMKDLYKACSDEVAFPDL